MLVLVRKEGQPVLLTVNGVDIWVMIGRRPERNRDNDSGRSSKTALTLCIEAPPEVVITRNELLPPIDRLECRPESKDYRHMIDGIS